MWCIRAMQAQFHADRLEAKRKAGRKVVWLGYLTDKPGGSSYKKLTDAGAVDVVPSEKKRYCLYLFHMGMDVSNFDVRCSVLPRRSCSLSSATTRASSPIRRFKLRTSICPRRRRDRLPRVQLSRGCIDRIPSNCALECL